MRLILPAHLSNKPVFPIHSYKSHKKYQKSLKFGMKVAYYIIRALKVI